MPITVVFDAAEKFQTVKGTVTVKADDYMKWSYFSFKKGKLGIYTIADSKEGGLVDEEGEALDETSFEWDLAIHREDFRTNGASVFNTEKTAFDEVTTTPSGEFAADEEGEVITDMSNMMDGEIIKAPFSLNPVLNTWITKDLSVMPPVYTIHKYVYVVKCKDGNYAKIQITDRTNDEGAAGYITFTYEYPSFAE